MSDIKKASFYLNWWDIAKTLEEKERLSFFEIIFTYYFEGAEPSPETPYLLKTLFLAVKPNIDADTNRKKGGAPVGNNNAKKTMIKTKGKTNIETNEVEVEEEVEVKEEVEVEVKDNYPTTTSYTKDIYINDFLNKNGLKLGKKTIKRLEEIVATTDIEGLFNFVKSKYPDKNGDELAKLFTSSLYWDNKKTTPKETQTIKIKKPKSLKACSFCGSSLVLGGIPNSYECPNCSPRTWWEFNNNDWVCNR